MAKTENKEDSIADETDQATAATDNLLLMDLVRSDCVVQTKNFLEACSSEENDSTNSVSVVTHDGCESIDDDKESARNDDDTKQQERRISKVFEKAEVISERANTIEKQKLSSDGDGNHENKEKMMVGNDKEKDISKNSSGAGGGDVDEKEIGEDGGSGQEEYVVEKILDKRYNRRKKRIEYLIKWAGYDSESENTWESAENCKSAPDAIHEYEESLKKNAKKYLLRSRSRKKENNSNDDGKGSSEFLKRKANEIKEEPCSEGNNGDDTDDVPSKVTKVDCILGVKKQGKEILALVRFEDGHHDIISTRLLVSKCPEKLVKYYERSLKFIT